MLQYTAVHVPALLWLQPVCGTPVLAACDNLQSNFWSGDLFSVGVSKVYRGYLPTRTVCRRLKDLPAIPRCSLVALLGKPDQYYARVCLLPEKKNRVIISSYEVAYFKSVTRCKASKSETSENGGVDIIQNNGISSVEIPSTLMKGTDLKERQFKRYVKIRYLHR